MTANREEKHSLCQGLKYWLCIININMVIEIDDASQVGNTNALYLNMDKLIHFFMSLKIIQVPEKYFFRSLMAALL